MAGKLVLVTGSGTGIGREVALEFAREGATVALHYAHSVEGAATAVGEIQRAGGKAEAFRADLSQIADARRLAAEAVAFLGGLDVLVNNAGITMNRAFEKVTPEQFDTLYHVNVRGQFFLTQAVLPAMLRRGGGAIVSMTSIHAFEGYTEHSVYAGTKGAIVAYTRALAIELAPRGIRVNAIAPGAVPVESHFRAAPGMSLEAVGKAIPVGFAGEPRDIARVAVFLASDDARYIVGQTLVVDGGTTSWMPFGDGFRRPMDAQFGRGYVPGL
ncbi:MAG: glucose 1-dehydrogenase [Planctomycetes bacterium]|nr:glucose 1-dehydrogenase [Planctomycetota bacterium]